jgi:hypothetical protein
LYLKSIIQRALSFFVLECVFFAVHDSSLLSLSKKFILLHDQRHMTNLDFPHIKLTRQSADLLPYKVIIFSLCNFRCAQGAKARTATIVLAGISLRLFNSKSKLKVCVHTSLKLLCDTIVTGFFLTIFVCG